MGRQQAPSHQWVSASEAVGRSDHPPGLSFANASRNRFLLRDPLLRTVPFSRTWYGLEGPWHRSTEGFRGPGEDGVNAIARLSVLLAVQSASDEPRGGDVGVGLAVAPTASTSALSGRSASAPYERKGSRVRQIGFEHGPGPRGGGIEEATVGLRNGCGWSEEEFRVILCEIHRLHYRNLVGLAAIWVDAAGEDAVQDAYVHVWSSWERIRDADKVLLYLRRAVVNNAMDELRHRRVTRRLLPGLSAPPRGDEDAGRPLWSRAPQTTDDEALGHMADEAIVLSVRGLAPQQSACVALRFYLGLSEKEIADVRNISTGAVKVHISRGKGKLRKLLEANGD